MSLRNRNGAWRYRFTFDRKEQSGTTRLAATERNRMAALQFAGLRDRITSPVRGLRSMKTSLVSKRNAAGRRTAWLRPLVKTLAFCRTINPSSPRIYTMIYSKALDVKPLKHGSQ